GSPSSAATGADSASTLLETIVEEVPVGLIYNGVPHVVMMATPCDLEDFAVGFSVTEGVVTRADEIRGVEVVRYSKGIELQCTVAPEVSEAVAARARRMSGRTGCGICGAESFDAVIKDVRHVGARHLGRDGAPHSEQGPTVPPAAISRAMRELGAGQVLNAATGAVHAAGWATRDGAVTTLREDVGRHNALDKLIGALLSAGVDPASGFVVVTSRASFEMVQKVTMLGAPMLAAISGPTGLAVRLAVESGLTLVGFVREGRMTAYAHEERLRG
ncbi:MAG: formate dehydrogenase accessory sulfurtransferase FdhD, partial [Gemmatimonadaceae bacterium]